MEAHALFGRGRELARLDDLLDGASALMLRGPRGSGVSALVDAGVARARDRGMGVLRATGVQWESGFAYAGLHQLLRRLRGAIAELPGAPGEALRASFGLTEATPSPADVALALVALASQAAADRPMLVAIDEWQWIDPETRAAVASFARRSASLPIALLLGGHVEGPPDVEELVVGPLDADASAALLPAALPMLVRSRILREAAGNPLALVELPEAYAGAGDGVLLGSWAPLTPALGEAFGAGVERLDAVAGLALLVAALDDGGNVAPILEAASRLAGVPLTHEALEPAVALGLIELDGDRLTFAHPLTRAAVRHRADPAARRSGHEAFAAVVAASDPTRAIWHRVVAAPGLDSVLAGELEAVAAGEDFERAAAALRRAANLTPPGPERSRRLAIAAQLTHEIGGVEVADRLLDQAGELDALGRARVASLRPGRTEAFLAHAREATDAGEHELTLRLLWLAATTERGASGEATIVPDPDAPERLIDARGHEPEVLARIAAAAAAAPDDRARPAAAPDALAPLDDAAGRAVTPDERARPVAAPDSLAPLDDPARAAVTPADRARPAAPDSLASLDAPARSAAAADERARPVAAPDSLGPLDAPARSAAAADERARSAAPDSLASLDAPARAGARDERARAAPAPDSLASLDAPARSAAAPDDRARPTAAPDALAPLDDPARAAVAPDSLALLGFAAYVVGDPRLAGELADRAIRRLRAQRRRTPLGPVLVLSAWAQLALSAFERAQADAAEAAWLNDRTRQPVWGAAAQAALAAVAALQGKAEVERYAAKAERVALPARISPVLALVQQARGALALADGRPAEAFAHLRRPFDPTDPAFDRPWAVNLLGDLAEAATTAEEREFVTALLADTPQAPAAAVAAAHARLALDENAGFGGVDERWAFTHARMLLLHGMDLRRARRMADSREPLRAAAAAFAALGATPWADRAARELAATVETTRRGEDRLTPQELEIARMAARGMTNPAIAADLALSPRTVSHHLARIFPKLEVSSRAGIGAALERLGY